MEATGEGFDVEPTPSHVYVEGGSRHGLTFTSATTLDDGNWHFVVVSTNGTTASAYVDGVSLGTQTFPSPLNTISSGELVIGGETNQTDGIAGTLAQLAIYPTALTAAQVQAQYQASGAASSAEFGKARPSTPTAARHHTRTTTWGQRSGRARSRKQLPVVSVKRRSHSSNVRSAT